MRVTEQQLFKILVNNVQRARVKALELQQQISTGKQVVLPSDDASAFDRIVANKTSIAKVGQWVRNLSSGITRLNMADSTLQDVSTTLGRAKELAVQFASSTNGPSERVIGAQEAKQLFFQLLQLGNTEYAGGQPVFGGTSRNGRATGVSITAPVALTSGSNDSLVVKVDGITSGTITLGTASLSGSALAALVQRKINTDSTLSAAGKSVTVTFATDHLVIASNNHGQSSSVEVTGGSGLSSLGFNGGSTTTGADAFALQASTGADVRNSGGALISQGAVYDRNAVTLDDYLVKFSAATTFNVYNVSVPVAVTANPANTGGVVKTDSGVVDPSKVTLDSYDVRFKNIYTVTTGTNDGIRFNPGTGAVTATLAAGSYTGSEFAAEIKRAMEAASGGKTYTVSFNDSTGKFDITNDVANAATLDLLYSDAAATAKTLMGSSGTDQSAIAAGGTATSDLDTAGLAGVSKQLDVYNTTLATGIINITSANNTLVVNDSGGGADRTITLTTGSYTGAQLATELATQLNASRDAANATAYTAAYGSVTAGRFTINNPAGNANSLILKFADAGSTAAQILGSTPVTVTETAGASASTLNSDAGYTTYSSGANIDFDGLRIVLQDGATGPRNGDSFSVAQAQQAVLSNQTYVSGSVIRMNGLQFSLRTGSAVPASGDMFRVLTRVQYQGDSGVQNIEIGANQTLKTNVPGDQVFTGPSTDLYAAAIRFVQVLRGNYGAGIGEGLADVNESLDQVLAAQGQIGALSSQLTTTSIGLETTKTFLESSLSNDEDTDMVEAISKLTLQQQALDAAGLTLNRIFENSLLNYMR